MGIVDNYASWNARAERVTTGTQSSIRVPFKFQPLFVEQASGLMYKDIDGKEYLDFVLGGGVGIFGTGYAPFTDRIKEEIDRMLYSSPGLLQTTREIELSERLTAIIPCAEKVRFCQAATEAIQLAIRVARAYTGRNIFIRFEGHYHGGMDNVLGGALPEVELNGRPFPRESETDWRRTQGRSKLAFQESFLLPWGDVDALEAILARYGDEVAMIIMEPVLCSMGACQAPPGYLEAVRSLADRFNVLLCFDEVITGFRMGLGGAQEVLGVTPDIAIFGKALGAGMPLAVLAGKKEVLDLLSDCRVWGAGTYNAFPLGVAAGLATIDILKRDDSQYYRDLDARQYQLVKGIEEISASRGIPTLVQGVRGVIWMMFTQKERAFGARDLEDIDRSRQYAFRNGLLEEGVLTFFGGRIFLSGLHSEQDISRALEAIGRVYNTLL